MTSIWWIRRDLRLTDNPALHSALQAGAVIPVFILNSHLLLRTPARRQAFLFDGLHTLNIDLHKRHSKLIIRKGKPIEALGQLMTETNATAIYAEEDYTPYACRRDQEAARQLPLKLIQGQTVHHPDFVKKSDGTPYTVYTPYSRKWKELLPTKINLFPASTHSDFISFPRSDEIPEFPSSKYFPAGEAEALETTRYIYQFIHLPICRGAQLHRLGRHILAFALFAIWDDRDETGCQCDTASHGRGTKRRAETQRRNLVERIDLARVLYSNSLSFSVCRQKGI